MTKCELIERERLINELTESSKHHAQTSREESLLYRDRQIVREQPTITEQEIVKPYLEKLKEQIVGKSSTEEFLDEDAFNSMYSESVSKDTAEFESYIEMTIVKMDDVLRLIDNLLSESEGEE